MRVFCSPSPQRGQALTEYMVACVFLIIIVWYALVGGSPTYVGGDLSDPTGGLWDDDPVAGTGTYLDEHQPGSVAAPGLIQALHKKQEDFASSIYEP